MLRLRKILLCDYLYYSLLILIITISLIRLTIPKASHYNETQTTIEGTIINYVKNNSTITMTIKAKEKLIVYYYLNNKENINLKLGDKIKITGEFNKPKSSTTKNLFNYQKYLYNKDIFYTVTATNIELISESKNPYYIIKNYLIKKTSSNAYLKAFLLGDKSNVDANVLTSYQENGISHLFAISGMHITLLSSIILKLLKHQKEERRYLYTSILLIIYLSLIGLSPSALRGVLFFILFSINKVYYFYIKPHNIFILVLFITLSINPYFIFDVGFQYSFLISLTLILKSKNITGNYLQQILKVSIYSFLVSLPISLYNYHQINILSILYNLFFVPLVSMLIFPLTLLVIILKPLLPIYSFLIIILEKTSLFLNDISIGKLIFKRLPIIVYIIYLVLIILLLQDHNKQLKKISFLIFSIILGIHYLLPTITNDTYITMIDVGQGDSILIHSQGESILIDTGGKLTYNNEQETSKIVKNITIPLLKILGIKKISHLILTHGDADHMGEANYLVDNFKVENIIINSGEINYLEKELIKKRKDVTKAYEGLQISCGDFELIQLNEEYQDENTSSQIYYATNGNINILLTGDASIESELNLIKKYDLPEIDILKVGHHGSKTSSSKKFINTIKPKYSLISCGKDNKFNHPNSSVLDTLKDGKIYRTDKNGSVTFQIKNNKLEIETCIP